MAGLRSDFPHLSEGGFAELERNIDTLESIDNPKEFFDGILIPNLAGNRMAIGTQVGAYFDVNRAKEKSASFNKFISSLEANGLL